MCEFAFFMNDFSVYVEKVSGRNSLYLRSNHNGMKCLIHWTSLIWIFCLMNPVSAQLNINAVSEAIYPGLVSPLTPVADVLGRPFLYVASNEYGLYIYETEPVLNLITSIDTNALGMKATSVTQVDSLLYIAVGGIFFGSTDPPGLVIVDVSDPAAPVILDSWFGPDPGHGTGIVRVQGNYAYLGGMPQGLVILNVSNPNAITFVSDLAPPITFPHPSNTQGTVNARGMAVRDSLVYLCYDAGGMRVISCADIYNPVQIAQFSNPAVDNTGPPFYWNVPRAYNNVVLDDTLAYIAVDYCGMEVWSIADPENPDLIAHWNPHNCPAGQWGDSPVHANELIGQFECDLVFLATGKSDLMVLDISDPYQPMVVDSFGTVLDDSGTWGLDVTNDFIYLTYVWTVTPFISNQPKIEKLSYTKCSVSLESLEYTAGLSPNPATQYVQLKMQGNFSYRLVDLNGRNRLEGEGQDLAEIRVEHLENGLYIVELEREGLPQVFKVIVAH